MCIIVDHCCCTSCNASLRFGCIFYVIWAIVWRILLMASTFMPHESTDYSSANISLIVVNVICLIGPICLLIGLFKDIKVLVVVSIVVTYLVVAFYLINFLVGPIIILRSSSEMSTGAGVASYIFIFLAICCPLCAFEVYMAIVQYSYLKTEM
ncbi:uncharacterized protein LOC115621581 [Scaptodrosophila lebanonensis]|uniref:Uncharacterized protein LOC115621581 n=1 Tax=Drosophila lebanonensis TaxID=7225 RepID=A0A6J2T2I2_DROLE|nr:uncharacterized protein LOC115621581 [Scaptodrosophila lebanonensis]XP_030371133.1 uncharacterized protein LOC115621581 [Scaptodrosophila lebanonensis]